MQLKCMAARKAADSRGVVIEMVQYGGGVLAETLAKIFTAIVTGESGVPDRWRRAVVKVLHKSGDTRDPANYRPICLLPVLYACWPFTFAGLCSLNSLFECYCLHVLPSCGVIWFAVPVMGLPTFPLSMVLASRGRWLLPDEKCCTSLCLSMV